MERITGVPQLMCIPTGGSWARMRGAAVQVGEGDDHGIAVESCIAPFVGVCSSHKSETRGILMTLSGGMSGSFVGLGLKAGL
jgi:hypothetical protein